MASYYEEPNRLPQGLFEFKRVQDVLVFFMQGVFLSLPAERFCRVGFLLRDLNKLDWRFLLSAIFSKVDGWYGLLNFTNSSVF